MIFVLRTLALFIFLGCYCTLLAQQSSQPINAGVYGVTCDGKTDDTSALSSAAAAASAGNSLLLLPQGTCRITGTVTIQASQGSYVSMKGYGASTKILADYSAWHGTNHDALEIVVAAAGIPALESQGEREISNFQVLGINNKSINDSVGVTVKSLATNVSPGSEANYSTYLSKFSNIGVTGFDTCYLINDAVSTDFDFIAGSHCRIGVNAKGYLIDDTFRALKLDFGDLNFTSATGITTGLLVNGKGYPCQNCNGGAEYQFPQGLVVADSQILLFGIDIDLESVQYMIVHDSVLDFALAGPIIKILNSTFVNIHDNYIYNSAANQPAVAVLAPGATQTALWIKDNFISGNGAAGQSGVAFLGGSNFTWLGVHVTGNHFQQFASPISVAQNIALGELSRNSGTLNTGPFIDISKSTLLGSMVIDANRTHDAQLPLYTGSSSPTGYQLGENLSATNQTPVLFNVGVQILE